MRVPLDSPPRPPTPWSLDWTLRLQHEGQANRPFSKVMYLNVVPVSVGMCVCVCVCMCGGGMMQLNLVPVSVGMHECVCVCVRGRDDALTSYL